MNYGLSNDEMALAAQAYINARGKDEHLKGKINRRPIQLQSVVYWASASSVGTKTFFDKTVNSTVGVAFTGTRTYPDSGLQNSYVEISHAKIVPNVAFAVLISSGTAADAYNYFIAGTQIQWKVGDTMVFEHNIGLLLPHVSVGVGAGTNSIISYTDQNYVELPEPIRIPKGENLSVVVIPPTGMTTAADAAATNTHYLNISTTVGIFTLQLFACGVSETAA